MIKKICAIVLAVFLFLPGLSVASGEKKPRQKNGDYSAYLLQAIHKSFNLEENAADASMKKALELEEDHPAGYAIKAMLHLFACEMSVTLEQHQKEKEGVFNYSGKALTRGEKRIAENPNDSQAYLAMAVAKVSKVHWAIREKRYLIMAQETLNVWSYLEAAKNADPENYDVDFLMGLLRYHIDRFAGLAGFVSSILITKGDRPQGLAQMHTAAQKGLYLREVAKMQLAVVYLVYEKKPLLALPIVKDLLRQFPDNYSFHFMHSLAMMEAGRFEEAESIAAQIKENIEKGQTSYAPELMPRYYQLMGRICQQKGQYEKAENFYFKVLEDKSFYNIRIVARSYLYLGMIADIRGKRSQALDYYNRVLQIDEADRDACLEARKYLRTPYQKEK